MTARIDFLTVSRTVENFQRIVHFIVPMVHFVRQRFKSENFHESANEVIRTWFFTVSQRFCSFGE